MFERYGEEIYWSAHPERGQLTPSWREYFEANILPHLPHGKSARILEIGCGAGQLLKYLSEQGYANLSGVDISPELVRVARQNGLPVEEGEAIHFLEACSREEFDCIVMIDVLEHIEKQSIPYLLKLIHDRLKPEGCCIIQVPNAANPIMGCSSLFKDFTHEILFTEESLCQVLKMAGFENVKVLKPRYKPKTVKTCLALIWTWVLEQGFKIMFRAYGRPTTTIFSKNLLAIARKERHGEGL